jgi:hypothetical protein
MLGEEHYDDDEVYWILRSLITTEKNINTEKRVAEANQREMAANERANATNQREMAAKTEAEKRVAEAKADAAQHGMRMTMAVVKAANKDFMNFSKFAFDRICNVAQDALGNATHLKTEAIPTIRHVETQLTTGVQGRLLLGPSSATFDFVTGTERHAATEVSAPDKCTFVYTTRRRGTDNVLNRGRQAFTPRKCTVESRFCQEATRLPRI